MPLKAPVLLRASIAPSVYFRESSSVMLMSLNLMRAKQFMTLMVFDFPANVTL